MKTIVVSAVNCVEGGTLRVFLAAVRAAADEFQGWRIVVLANRAELIDDPRVEVLAFPAAKRRYLSRLYHEWVVFRRLASELRPDIWLSMHDMTAIVPGRRHFVYCHNPMPFYQLPLREAVQQPLSIVQNRLYGLFYRAFLKRNEAVIVQQDWLRREFLKWGAPQVIVAHPVDHTEVPPLARPAHSTRFFYPSLSRAFKNFEVIGEALRLLAREPRWRGEVAITISGDEDRYARWLRSSYGDVPGLRFIGRQSYAQMAARYEEADCLIFPSRLETWGLPITEAKARGIPLIVADLPYGHETVGASDYVRFFEPNDARRLADIMLDVHLNGWRADPVRPPDPATPFARDWGELMRLVRDGTAGARASTTSMRVSETQE